MTRGVLATVLLVLALPLADLTPARAGEDNCARQSRRVRLPSGFAEARMSFVGTGRPVTVTTRLPVTGSAITDSGLYGEWCAEVFLDDDDAPIARRRFFLTPP